MDNPIISMNDFSFKYNDAKLYSLRHISFDVAEGEFFCIIGSNGAGKSTICNALTGLVPQQFPGTLSGTVTVCGHDASNTKVADLSLDVGLVFQNPFNQLSYTAQSVGEELAYGLGNRGVPRDEMIDRVQKVAELVHVEQLLDRNPLALSGGQVQRVALGSTLILNPKVLVLDECTTQLDPMGSDEIFEIIKQLNKEGTTIVMVDHDMERVAQYADRVLALEAGNFVALGTPEEIFTRTDLEEHGIDSPEFVQITRALGDAGLTDGQLEVTEEPTVAMVREVLGR